jgi:hypothetical protein
MIDRGRSVLRFTETGFLNEGGAASISFALGKITGLHFVPQQDSSVGEGELLAFSKRGIYDVPTGVAAGGMEGIEISTGGALQRGGARGWAIVSINGDVWFRSDDGWRSYRQARSGSGTAGRICR